MIKIEFGSNKAKSPFKQKIQLEVKHHMKTAETGNQVIERISFLEKSNHQYHCLLEQKKNRLSAVRRRKIGK